MRPSTKARMATEAAAFFAGMGAGIVAVYMYVWPVQLRLIQQAIGAASVAGKGDRIDTFNVRWVPVLPEIRTDLGAPHCIVTACRVV